MLLTGQSFYMVIHLYPTRKNILSSFATVPDAQWFLFPFWTNYLLLLINQPNLFCFGFTTRQHNLWSLSQGWEKIGLRKSYGEGSRPNGPKFALLDLRRCWCSAIENMQASNSNHQQPVSVSRVTYKEWSNTILRLWCLANYYWSWTQYGHQQQCKIISIYETKRDSSQLFMDLFSHLRKGTNSKEGESLLTYFLPIKLCRSGGDSSAKT